MTCAQLFMSQLETIHQIFELLIHHRVMLSDLEKSLLECFHVFGALLARARGKNLTRTLTFI